MGIAAAPGETLYDPVLGVCQEKDKPLLRRPVSAVLTANCLGRSSQCQQLRAGAQTVRRPQDGPQLTGTKRYLL